MNKISKLVYAVVISASVVMIGCKQDDITNPTLVLNGDSVVKIDLGQVYAESGATAGDDRDGDLTKAIITSGIVDNTKCGKYTLTYEVNDEAGNADSKTRTVYVKSDKLAGTYGVNDVVTNSQVANGTFAYDITVAQSSTIYNRVLISNFGGFAQTAIYANVEGTAVTIPSQTTTVQGQQAQVTVSGSGTYDGTQLALKTINYNAGTSLGNGAATLVKK